jgi:hypothetical protein
MCVPVYVKKKKERRLRSIIVSSVNFMTQLFTEFITNEAKTIQNGLLSIFFAYYAMVCTT